MTEIVEGSGSRMRSCSKFWNKFQFSSSLLVLMEIQKKRQCRKAGEEERSAHNWCICSTTTISHQTVGERLACEPGKKYLITTCNISLSSCSGKRYWGLPDKMNETQLTHWGQSHFSECFLFHFPLWLVCHLTDYDKDPVLSWSKLQSQRVQRYKRERNRN